MSKSVIPPDGINIFFFSYTFKQLPLNNVEKERAWVIQLEGCTGDLR